MSTITEKLQSSSLLTLPLEIREQIYDLLLPQGVIIKLRINAAQTSLQHVYSIAQSCRGLNEEIKHYLDKKPWIIHSSRGMELTILSGIPSQILSRVSVLVIEDSPDAMPNWGLLKRLRYICFTEIYESKIDVISEGSNTAAANATNLAISTTLANLVADPDASVTDLTQVIPPPVNLTFPVPPASHLPPTSTVLRDAQLYWKRLRLTHTWIRYLQNSDHPTGGKIRVVLRRVSEAELPSSPGSPVKKLIGWHSLVDVHTRKVLESGWLPERTQSVRNPSKDSPELAQLQPSARVRWGDTEDPEQDDYAFPYGVMYSWWKNFEG